MPIEGTEVLRLGQFEIQPLQHLLSRFQLSLEVCAKHQPIISSFWGDQEAGLRGPYLYARDDTPLHSILHEASHYICLDPIRRQCLDRDAGSDDAEETAVCYLQILLSDQLPNFGRQRMFSEMDRWGYSFRLGSTQAWFEEDSNDPRLWLVQHELINQQGQLQFKLRLR